MSFNIFDLYFPAPEEITSEQMQDMRTRLKLWLSSARPDLDTRPGSLFDFSALSPLSALLAGVNVMLERIRTDLSPADVSQGLAYDCAFVESYLTALGGLRQESLEAAGVMELRFSADAEVEIPAGWQVRFGDAVYSLVDSAGVRVIRRGQQVQTSRDRRLFKVADGIYAVRLPVTATSSVAVASGASGEGSTPLPDNLVSITAVQDFRIGRANNSAAAMAARVQQAFQFRGFSTPASIREQLLAAWPDLRGVSVAAPGDRELLRPGSNAFGIQTRMADAWISSYSRGAACQETVRCAYQSQDDVFILRWAPSQHLVKMLSLAWADDAAVSIEAPDQCLTQVSTSVEIDNLDASGTSLAEFFLVIPMPRNAGGDPLITPLDDDDGPYGMFQISYATEPALPVVEQYITDQRVIGLDLRARSAVRVEITGLACEFVRQPGVVFNEAQARAEIKSYVDSILPGDGFDVATIYNILLVAGALRGIRLNGTATAYPSPAAYVAHPAVTPPTDNYAAFLSEREAVTRPTADVAAADFDFVDPTAKVAVTPRNCVYSLEAQDITFTQNLP